MVLISALARKKCMTVLFLCDSIAYKAQSLLLYSIEDISMRYAEFPMYAKKAAKYSRLP